jgi:RNA polymerase sigma-70 factor (ECF subfamily)
MSGEAVPGSATARLNDLLDAIGEGDRPALEELCRHTQAKLYGVALRILRRPELAEQALRDGYLRIWHDASAYAARHSDPMIFAVAAVRRAAFALARKAGEGGLDAVAKPPAAPAEGEQPAAPPVLSAELKRLLAALAGLSEDLRRMLLLAYYDGWSRQALAAEFDAPVGTVATWLRRSLGQLRGER